MTDFLSKRDRAVKSNVGYQSKALDWDNFPCISTLLNGSGNPETGAVGLPSHSFTIWSEGDLVKVCIGAGDAFPKAYYSFGEFDHLLEQIEQALKEEKFDWKKVKKGWEGFTPKNR